jgi:hypothetical protein
MEEENGNYLRMKEVNGDKFKDSAAALLGHIRQVELRIMQDYISEKQMQLEVFSLTCLFCTRDVRQFVMRSYMNLRNAGALQQGPHLQKCVLPLADRQ